MLRMLDAIVVGAGISGIAAARELAKQGLSVRVLEARNRLGGRLNTDRTAGSAPYELGCSWLHESLDNPLWAIAEENGIDLVYDDSSAMVFNKDGPIDPALGQLGSDFGAFVGVHFEDNKQDVSLKEMIDKFAKFHPKMTAEQKKALPQTLRIPQISKGQDWNKVSAKSLLSAPKGRDLLVLGGYDKIYNVIKQGIEDKISTGTPVESIDTSDPSKVTVKTASEEITAKYVIVSAPVGVLKKNGIKFVPEPPSEFKAALDTTDVAEVGKVYFEFEKAFWPDMDKFVFVGDSEAVDGTSTSYPLVISNWYKFNGSGKYPGLGIITPPPLTNKFESDPSKAFDHFTPALEALRTDKSVPLPKPTKVTSSKWTVDPYSQGSYSTYTVGNDREEAVKAFEKGFGRVRFAGEHTTVRGATFAHGAYRSGIREASKIVDEVTKGRL